MENDVDVAIKNNVKISMPLKLIKEFMNQILNIIWISLTKIQGLK